MINEFDAYGRLMQHKAGHKISVSFIQMVTMQAIHEGKKLTFEHVEHMLDVIKKEGKSLSYGCLLTRCSSSIT